MKINQKPKTKNQKSSRFGFTLIELMVVIVIIGILAVIASVALVSARKSSRDARRKADISSISGALEIYKVKIGTYVIPTEKDIYNNWAGANGYATKSEFLPELRTNNVIGEVSNDPLFDANGDIPRMNSYSYLGAGPLITDTPTFGNGISQTFTNETCISFALKDSAGTVLLGQGFAVFGWLENENDADVFTLTPNPPCTNALAGQPYKYNTRGLYLKSK